jgi:uncharacterized protein (TIGR00661 family)
LANILEINNTYRRRPKILVAPLDWGLGHATRCIPVINQLLKKDCEIIIASEGPQKALLEAEFPAIRFVSLPGYRLKYGRGKWQTWLKIIFQIPKILIRIKQENRWIQRFLLDEELDALISDNRYGLYSAAVFSVFITHQLHIKTYFGKKIDSLLGRMLYPQIGKFSCCWVPDFAGPASLCGILSHPVKLPTTPIRYLGPLTRFRKSTDQLVIKDGLLVLLSGPEPQRTIFENVLLRQLRDYTQRVVFIRGLPGTVSLPLVGENIEIFNHLSVPHLNQFLLEASYVIARAGYSSIMDLLLMGKKTILVPTPGQPEQEYLAGYLFEKHLIFSCLQAGFSLRTSLESANRFPYLALADNGQFLLNESIDELLQSIQSSKT